VGILLSIDWDWVTGDCSPSGQDACCGWCDDPLRPLRGRGIERYIERGWDARLQRILDAIMQQRSGHERLWVAECHADILRVVNPSAMEEIVHLDYHGDDDKWCQLCCGTWRTFLPSNVRVKRTLDPGDSFRDIFICLSSPWTPVEMDKEFWDMVSTISGLTIRPEFIGHRKHELKKAWLKYESLGPTKPRMPKEV